MRNWIARYLGRRRLYRLPHFGLWATAFPSRYPPFGNSGATQVHTGCTIRRRSRQFNHTRTARHQPDVEILLLVHPLADEKVVRLGGVGLGSSEPSPFRTTTGHVSLPQRRQPPRRPTVAASASYDEERRSRRSRYLLSSNNRASKAPAIRLTRLAVRGRSPPAPRGERFNDKEATTIRHMRYSRPVSYVSAGRGLQKGARACLICLALHRVQKVIIL
jgi:hypothetical protein